MSKQERIALADTIKKDIMQDLTGDQFRKTRKYFADDDTYIRKAAYLAIGQIYFSSKELQPAVINILNILLPEKDFKVRQSVINAAGEIGRKEFDIVQHFFDVGLFDVHHSPRNAVIGSIKKMGEVNPDPVLSWARKYLHHHDKEIRREICHGIELRGRKHPGDILPLLKELQFDNTTRVKKTLVHVLGQIAYKKGCLAITITELKTWENRELVAEAINEIKDVHHRYRNFSALTEEQANEYISQNT
jgi:hypothetical protein